MKMASSSSYLLVAAIDFGTTYSGYAYSFRSNPNDIKMNANWSSGAGFQTYKTPTCVLLNKEGEFEAFGYMAEEEYGDDENQEMHLFSHFKMMLYETAISKNQLLKSSGGKYFKAVDVFTHALRYLKDHLMNSINNGLDRNLEPSDIRWVITVPAIWRDKAKQFMREAAFKAGCISDKSSKQLLLTLEPEAASFLGTQLHSKEGLDVLSPGTRYIMLDCGGGTNDVAIHELLDKDRIKEIISPKGGPWGGNVVNEKFVILLGDIFGKENIEKFKKDHHDKYIYLMHQFEQSKRKVQEKPNAKLRVNLPREFDSMYSKTESAENRIASVSNGVLMLPQDVARSLFDEAVNHILQGVAEIMDSRSDISLIMMAGGFSESRWLQDAVRHEFEPRGCRVLVLEEAQLAVVKGAVLFGHSQDRVVSRKARKTYGYGCRPRFDEIKHNPRRKFIDELYEERCRGVLMPFIVAGDDINTDSVISKNIYLTKSSTSFNMGLYSLERKPNPDVEYHDHPDVILAGEVHFITLNPEGLKKRIYDLTFSFGGTEIFVVVYDRTTDKYISTTIDFLSE